MTMNALCSKVPSITGLMSLSAVFSVMEEHSECRQWMNSNYILPFYDPAGRTYYLAGGDVFGCNPWILYNTSTTAAVMPECIADNIESALLDGFAVYTKIDCKGIFWEEHRTHDVFVVGCDRDERTFTLLGPDLGLKPAKWGYKVIPMELFEKGYEYNFARCEKYLFLKLGFNRGCGAGYSQSTAQLMLSDFLCSRLSTDCFEKYFYKVPGCFDPIDRIDAFDFFRQAHAKGMLLYGLKSYDGLIEYINTVDQMLSFDFRPLKLFYERILSMETKARGICSSPSVHAMYGELSAQAAAVFYGALKGKVKDDKGCLEHISRKLLKVKQFEANAAEALLTELNKAAMY